MIKLGSGQLRYQDSGDKKNIIIFLHGFNGQLSHWNPVWSRLDNCARTIRLDIPGYGGSVNWKTDTYTLPAQGRRIIKFMDLLKLDRVTLVGVSMGGSLSAWIASQYPERINSLLLLAPSGYSGSLNYGGVYGRLVKPGLPNKLSVIIARSKIYKTLFPNSRALQALTVTSSYGHKWDEALRNIHTPTIILWSKGDKGVPVQYANAVSSSITNSILVPLAEDAGHNIPKTRPELVAKISCQLSNGINTKQIYDDIWNQNHKKLQ